MPILIPWAQRRTAPLPLAGFAFAVLLALAGRRFGIPHVKLSRIQPSGIRP